MRGWTPIHRRNAGVGEENRTFPPSLIKLPTQVPVYAGEMCFETSVSKFLT